MKIPLAIRNFCQETPFPKIWTLLKMEINELLKIKYSQMAQTITWIERRIKGHAANCDKVQCLQHLTHCRNLKQNIVAEQMDVKAKSNIMN